MANSTSILIPTRSIVEFRASVIIPTRERAQTLEHCLRSCVEQDYADLEIIVSDNASCDETRDVVAAVADPRVRYVNTGRRLDMSANWDYALSHATGDFVLYIGDDDAVTPGGVSKAMQMLHDSEADCVGWQSAQYGWPDHSVIENRGRLSFAQRSPPYLRSAKHVWGDFCQGKLRYDKLFALYHGGFSPRKIMQERVQRHGRFFRATAPDIFSAIVLTTTVRNQIYAEWPLVIAGSGAKSNGSSIVANANKLHDDTGGEIRRYLDEVADTPWNRRLHPARSLQLAVADAWLSSAEAPDGSIADDGQEILSCVLPWAVVEAMQCPDASRAELLDAVRKTALKNGLVELAASSIAIARPKRLFTEISEETVGIAFNELEVSLRDPYLLPNVYIAARMVGSLAPLSQLSNRVGTNAQQVFWLHRLRRLGARLWTRFMRSPLVVRK